MYEHFESGRTRGRAGGQHYAARKASGRTMGLMGTACALLLVLTTLIHYEALRGRSVALPRLRLPSRANLIVVIIASFAARIVEVALYAVAIYAPARWFGVGTLGSMPVPSRPPRPAAALDPFEARFELSLARAIALRKT